MGRPTLLRLGHAKVFPEVSREARPLGPSRVPGHQRTSPTLAQHILEPHTPRQPLSNIQERVERPADLQQQRHRAQRTQN